MDGVGRGSSLKWEIVRHRVLDSHLSRIEITKGL
jgi:hypothetical protein